MTAGGEGTYGVAPWNKGKPWNDEIKTKQGLKNKGNKHWVGRKHLAESIAKQAQAKTQFKFIGTNIITGDTLEIIGKAAMKNAGFCSTHVYGCANGKDKSHKGFTWVKERLENKV